MRRLDFARKANVRVVDAKSGRVTFTPDPGKRFDYRALERAYRRASYGIERLELSASGLLEEHTGGSLVLNVRDTGNVFLLRPAAGASVTFPDAGTWVTVRGVLQPAKEEPHTLLVSSLQRAAEPRVDRPGP